MVSPIMMLGGIGQLQPVITTGVGVGFVWGESASSATLNAHAIAVLSGDRHSFSL